MFRILRESAERLLLSLARQPGCLVLEAGSLSRPELGQAHTPSLASKSKARLLIKPSTVSKDL